MMNLVIIGSVLILTGLLPLILLLLNKKIVAINHPVVPFVWLTAVSSIYEWVVTAFFKLNAAFWFQIYPLICFCTIYYFFYKLLNKEYKKVFRLSIILFCITYGTSFYFFDKTNVFISTAINEPVLTLFILICSFLWFKVLFEDVKISNLWMNDDFYFVSGLMIYHSGTFFFFLLSGFIFSSDTYFYDYWMVNIIATVVLRIFLIVGIWRMESN